jgi:hypothetical protein
MTGKNHKNLSQNRQDSQCLGRDFNPRAPEYNAEYYPPEARGDMLPSDGVRRPCSAVVPQGSSMANRT